MIRMIGIDHSLAPVSVRSKFTFLKNEMIEAMSVLKEDFHADGIIILATCNRMEVWMSGADTERPLLDAVCALKGLGADEYREFFVERNDEEAERHLFYLTSGLKSAIIAEDQILTQVGDALAFARANYFTDGVLEVLFRKAVSAAKKVKTEVHFTRANATAIGQAVELLKKKGFDPAGRKCMVIGNGEYGRLAALTLKDAGADVTVTVRQYHSGMVLIPEGCRQIHYGEKMDYFPQCDIVVSATASPNYTLFYDKVAPLRVDHPMMLIDFAVPPDIEPSIGSLPQYTLYDIDSFRTGRDEANREAYEQTRKILDAKLEEFRIWMNYRDLVPHIRYIQEEGTDDIERRLTKTFRKLHMEESDEKELRRHIEDASGKVISKMLFTLRDSLDEESFRRCINILENAYTEEEAAYEMSLGKRGKG